MERGKAEAALIGFMPNLAIMAKAVKKAASKKRKSKYDITVKVPEGMTADELLKKMLNTPIKKKKK